mmetsp:Transcript_584/g.1358  ORF Transcript_584/g.1358 Transcript_584/m.1358 type:complete len:969 (+) Transcript_584:65-2971(+)
MPIDEFGREVPAGASGASSSALFADPLRSGGNDHEMGEGGGAAAAGSGSVTPPNGDANFESRRRGRSRSFDRTTSSGGGGGDDHHHRRGRKRSRSHSVGGDRDHGEDNNHHHRSSSRHHHHHHSRGHYDHSNRRGGGVGRRHRSRSYGHDEDNGGGHHYHNKHSSSGRGGGSRGEKADPSLRYVEQPLLCQFIWKKEQEEQAKKDIVTDEAASDDKVKKDDADMSNDDSKDDDDVAKDDVPSKELNSDEGGDNNDDTAKEEGVPATEEEETAPQPPPLFESEEAEAEAYGEYNSNYCLDYVRKFFNHHLDDPWFRRRLSPLETYRQAKKERTRANEEATELRKEILQSLEDMQAGVIPKKDPDCPDYLGPPRCNFVGSCRLGVGNKPTSALSYRRDYNNYDAEGPSNQHLVLPEEDRNKIEHHAKGHLHSFVKSGACVKIMDVPSQVSDEQLLTSLTMHCKIKPPSAVWSSSVFVPTVSSSRSSSRTPYNREAYAVFPSTAAKEDMFDNLQKANEDASRHHRREDRHKDRRPRFLDLEVDCTDIYGRRELDADGNGGAPPKKKKDDDSKIPSKRCKVFISTSLISSSQPVSVLSAAVSSRERISGDKEDAKTISRALDEARGIEAGNCLSDLMLLLYPGNELASADEEDILDIAIAYLRRVHLFSFYNGCTSATDVGDVLSDSHPSGTIHLRLRNADEILRKTADENGPVAMDEDGGDVETDKGDAAEGSSAGRDMLVTRLNDSIAKALENAKIMEDRGPGCVVDEETDMAARDIETSEQNSREQWMQNHEIMDEDGRARCSFHFCRKLFKDKAFLQKHLLKKHSDQLRAERGKCHDGVMMVAWDNDEKRPVPPILLDCGSKFGLVHSAVTGSGRPIANDPEPDLWKEEEERIAEEEKRYQERQAAAEAAAKAREEDQLQRKENNTFSKGNFVDVDDMVEEKVELKFENIDVAPATKPKKKKRKKSLL